MTSEHSPESSGDAWRVSPEDEAIEDDETVDDDVVHDDVAAPEDLEPEDPDVEAIVDEDIGGRLGT
jgi:hypothetical protein